MGLAEAQDAETFRTGVRGRLQSLGEQVGMRRVIAGIPVSNSRTHIHNPVEVVGCVENSDPHLGLPSQCVILEKCILI